MTIVWVWDDYFLPLTKLLINTVTEVLLIWTKYVLCDATIRSFGYLQCSLWLSKWSITSKTASIFRDLQKPRNCSEAPRWLKIWMISLHSYTELATDTMSYRAPHSKTSLKSELEANSLILPTWAALLLQTERKTDGSPKCCWWYWVYITIHFRSHNGICWQGLLMMLWALCTHLESCPRQNTSSSSLQRVEMFSSASDCSPSAVRWMVTTSSCLTWSLR